MPITEPGDNVYGVGITMKHLPKGSCWVHWADVSGQDVIALFDDDGTKVDGEWSNDVIPNKVSQLVRTAVTSVSSKSGDANASKDYHTGVGTYVSNDEVKENVIVKLFEQGTNARVILRIPTTQVKKAAALKSQNAYFNLVCQIAQRIGMMTSNGHQSPDLISVDGYTYSLWDILASPTKFAPKVE